MDVNFWINGREYRLSIEEEDEKRFQVTLGDKKYLVLPEHLGSNEILLNINGRIYDVVVELNSSCCSVYLNGKYFEIEKKSASRILNKAAAKQITRSVKTSMPGRIVKVLVNEGEKVREGEAVLILEAMKMENEIKSPQSGVIKEIKVKPGDQVEAGIVLFAVG